MNERRSSSPSPRSIARSSSPNSGHLAVDAASPIAAAPRITARVLLIHGAADGETPPSHSQRVYEALRGSKRLLLVPNAGHNASLRADVWSEVERWIENSPSFRNE